MYLGNNRIDIDVLADNGCIITPQFESHTLESSSTGGHDFLSCCDRASEADLGDIRVGSQLGTQTLLSAQGLENAWWEDLGTNFSQFECRIW